MTLIKEGKKFDMKITTAKSKRYIKKYIKIIEENKLHSHYNDAAFKLLVNGKSHYAGFEVEDITAISLCKKDDQYVGVAISVSDDSRGMHGCNVGCFIKSKYRRQGIGSKLTKKVIDPEHIRNYQFPKDFPK